MSGQTVRANLGTIPANGSATLTIVTNLLAGAGPSLSDSASVTLDEIDSKPANNTASISTIVVPVADLRFAFSATPTTAHVGDALTFTLTATNNGPSAASNVVVTLPLGSDVAFVSSTVTQGNSALTGGRVQASLGGLAVGAQARLTIVVQASSVGTLSFTGSVSTDEVDPAIDNNSASASIVVQPVGDVAVAVAGSPSRVAVGQNLVYTITATNMGAGPATDVTLTDMLPAGAAFLFATSSLGAAPVQKDGALIAAIGTLLPGASATMHVTVQATAAPGSSLSTTASVAAAEFDSDPSNNTATLAVPIRDASNLRVTMTPSVPSVPIGQPLGFSIVVANPGPADEPDAVLSIPLPSVVTLLSCSASQGPGLKVSATGIAVDLGPIPVGTTATISLSVSPLAKALGLLTMTSSASGYNADLDPAQSQASATVTVNPAAGLSIAIAPQKASAYQDANLTYTMTVFNSGPSDASNVIATSPLATGADFVSASASQGLAPTVRRRPGHRVAGNDSLQSKRHGHRCHSLSRRRSCRPTAERVGCRHGVRPRPERQHYHGNRGGSAFRRPVSHVCPRRRFRRTGHDAQPFRHGRQHGSLARIRRDPAYSLARRDHLRDRRRGGSRDERCGRDRPG